MMRENLRLDGTNRNESSAVARKAGKVSPHSRSPVRKPIRVNSRLLAVCLAVTIRRTASSSQTRQKGEGRRKSRSFCSLQDGNEDRGQLFALTRVLPTLARSGCPSMSHCFPLAPFLSERSEFFRGDDPRFHKQFQPVSALTRCFPINSPATSQFYHLCRGYPTRSILQSREANRRISQ
jgi:hypothetical protein